MTFTVVTVSGEGLIPNAFGAQPILSHAMNS